MEFVKETVTAWQDEQPILNISGFPTRQDNYTTTDDYKYLQKFIGPLTAILHGLQSGRYRKGLSSLQKTIAIDRLRRIIGVLHRPATWNKYSSILQRVQKVLEMWFPQSQTNPLHPCATNLPQKGVSRVISFTDHSLGQFPSPDGHWTIPRFADAYGLFNSQHKMPTSLFGARPPRHPSTKLTWTHMLPISCLQQEKPRGRGREVPTCSVLSSILEGILLPYCDAQIGPHDENCVAIAASQICQICFSGLLTDALFHGHCCSISLATLPERQDGNSISADGLITLRKSFLNVVTPPSSPPSMALTDVTLPMLGKHKSRSSSHHGWKRCMIEQDRKGRRCPLMADGRSSPFIKVWDDQSSAKQQSLHQTMRKRRCSEQDGFGYPAALIGEIKVQKRER
uniref:Uncharacterized protein n=1 Tax=Eptatretus burgeri TaxID=7764 RepID=A0A8C4NAZ7_EPTBU